MRISDWSSDVCSSDLRALPLPTPIASSLISGNSIIMRGLIALVDVMGGGDGNLKEPEISAGLQSTMDDSSEDRDDNSSAILSVCNPRVSAQGMLWPLRAHPTGERTKNRGGFR